MYTKQVAVCIILIVGCFISLPHSNAIHSSNSDNRNFKENDMLRDEDHLNDNGANRIAHHRVPNVLHTINNDNDDNDDIEMDISDDGDNDNISIDDSGEQLSLKDQVHLLTKQMSALMKRQRTDYKTIENHLKKSMRKSTITTTQFNDSDMRSELEQLR